MSLFVPPNISGILYCAVGERKERWYPSEELTVVRTEANISQEETEQNRTGRNPEAWRGYINVSARPEIIAHLITEGLMHNIIKMTTAPNWAMYEHAHMHTHHNNNVKLLSGM